MDHFTSKSGISASKKNLLVMLSACFFAIACVQKQAPMKITSEDPMVKNFYDNQFLKNQ